MTETATPAPDDVPADLRHDPATCPECYRRLAHVRLVARRNADRVVMYAVVGFRPSIEVDGRPFALTFWTGHDGEAAGEVFRQVSAFVSDAQGDAYSRAILGPNAGAPKLWPARLVGEPGAEAVTFKGPAVRPPLPPTPPAPPMEPAPRLIERFRPPTTSTSPAPREKPEPKPPRVREGWLAWLRRRLRGPS